MDLGLRVQCLGFMVITVSCTCAPSALRLSGICLPSLGDVARFNALRQSHQCDATSTHLPRACRVHRRPRTNPPPGHDATVAPLRACAAPRRTASLSYCPAGRCQKSILVTLYPRSFFVLCGFPGIHEPIFSPSSQRPTVPCPCIEQREKRRRGRADGRLRD